MDHTHHWRATSKVFALVCDCGVVCHEWLSKEIDRLTAGPSQPVVDVAAGLEVTIQQLNGEVLALRTQLEAAQREATELKSPLETAQREASELKLQLETARRELEALRSQPAPVTFPAGRPVEGAPAESGEPT